MSQDQLKQRVAEVAIELTHAWLSPKDILGVGTGSTVNFYIDELGKRNLDLRGAFSSSDASTRALQEIGVEVLDSNCGERAALYIDGADEVDALGALIKGAGGALTREKIVASLSDSFVCLVDKSKVVERLGECPLPVEVIPMAKAHVEAQIVQLGGLPTEREGVQTDNGNLILDVERLDLSDPESVERRLNNIPGVVENGIFSENRPSVTLVGHDCGVELRCTKTIRQRHASKWNAIDVCCETLLN
ncbi:MAG: ribose-5-phosphate isomerase RpiA [Gammaproteobacteria bacterium]|nr:ribose-5-phosphate isomerase RpiA [Gammaproteobacteria bacterium]